MLSSEHLITRQVQTNGVSVGGKATRVMEGDPWIYEERLKELNRQSSINDDLGELGEHLLISEGCKRSAA